MINYNNYNTNIELISAFDDIFRNTSTKFTAESSEWIAALQICSVINANPIRVAIVWILELAKTIWTDETSLFICCFE